MELKDVLISYRKKHGLSQREFARQCNLSNSLICILENGVNKQTGKKPTPDTETYKKLATGMGITVQELFEMLGDSEMVSLQRNSARHLVVPDTELFRKIILGMEPEDYETVMRIFEKTEIAMRERGEL